jgi:hypothetical protein
MRLLKVYSTLDDFDDYVKRHLTQADLEEFKDHTFVPLKIKFNETDMSIEALIVPVKS